MEADAEPSTFLILMSYVPVLKRVASLIRILDVSVVLSIDSSELDTSSFPSLHHSIAGKGFARSPTLIFTEAPALYCTISKYSGGRSIAGAPEQSKSTY